MNSRFQPLRLLRPFLILLFLAAVSYWLNPVPWQHLGPETKILFGVTALVVAVLIATVRTRMHLHIDERGIEIKYAVGATKRYAWNDIESASIFRVRFLLIPMTSSIHLKLAPQARSADATRQFASAITGSNVSFPAWFDESAEEIIEKIEFFKRESLSAAKTGSAA